MAQTQPQQFAQSMSPPVSSPSPSAPSPVNGGGIPPPSKRQRLSPLPQSQSPYASPSFGTLQLPSNQPTPTPMNGINMSGMPQTPAPPPPPGTMGPPSRPVEKATDAAELTDVLASSGIDVREEEAFLTSSYSAPGVQAQQPLRVQLPPPPQQQPQLALNTSFASQASTTGTISTTPSFSEPSQFKPQTTQDSFYTEPASQPPAPFKDPNEPTREDTEAARRAQYHLQEPFLLTKVLEQRLQRRGFELGVRIPAEGLFHPVPGRPQPIEVTGPDGSSIVRTGKTILNQEGAPLVDILNLMSIACEERLRTVVDYSSTLARSRRAHSHGKIPIEWKDLAESSGSVNGGVDNPQTPLKRKHQIQIRKSPSIDKKGLSKKEARKLMDAKASEAQQHQQSVETARLATNSMLSGRMFGAKKSYSWLNRGSATPSGFATPSRVNTAPLTTGAEKTGRTGEPAPVPTKHFGTWREDKAKGAGIQVRDILFMLEMDGRGSRHVQKAYSKDIKEDRAD
ncbi:uncharacterized protein P174DRAFT_440905 [Aspergillus novofumigatus IBT 16806]|uniref:Transcription initiation factor TFIID subunit 4 n=1 Tax=Aspergillus novofumigatus (strain IBT 16806) TaxID=1392255 RepID=A0A2I1C7T8_ASPN1|nr:uncharacterized protein P174DRAFT_440905 [Aspergillus novofumigatus IBT 16806]PKX93641.1 hypothetical protein P174DRAFT_440905 [Aspergillus novofumigatus IBT 16806]